MPDAKTVSTWAAKLKKDPRLRRIDVVRAFLKQAGRAKTDLSYSNPWANNPEFSPPSGKRSGKRDVGAVVMFFFNCPGGVNCGMDWANNHVLGMQGADA
jgi:hypothetical protein